MSFELRDYLQHILDEAEYLRKASDGLCPTILIPLLLITALSSCERLDETRHALAFWQDMRSQTLATTRQYHQALGAADIHTLCRVTLPDACARFRAGTLPPQHRRQQYRDAATWDLESFALGPAEAQLYGTYTSEGVLHATMVRLVWSDSTWRVSNPYPTITEY